MTAVKRHGPGWVAIGDAAGLVNPMNGEGIDYGLESGMLASNLFLADPATAPERYDIEVGDSGAWTLTAIDDECDLRREGGPFRHEAG